MGDVRVITTEDGSHSLYVPHLHETYHSSFGAVTESEHIFIGAGLDFYLHSRPVHKRADIFELGFGTGLNALLTYRYALDHQISLTYSSVESDPLPPEFALKLNYPQHLSFDGGGDVFRALHESLWDREVMLSGFFSLKKIRQRIEVVSVRPETADVVYFDAFAPGVQPDIWSRDILAGMFERLREGGILVTYCAQGQFRRDLKAVGFRVEKLPGPPGKKEIVRAVKNG